MRTDGHRERIDDIERGGRSGSVDDVLIAVLYLGADSEFSRGGPRSYNDTPSGYEPWFGAILLSRRHVNQTDVMVPEIGHVIGLASFSHYGPESVIRYVNYQNHTFEGPESQRVNGGEPVPFQWVNSNREHVPPGTSGATPDYSHFGVCDSIMAYCRNRREVLGPTELDFAFLADIGYDVLDAQTASEPELYGYGAWGRYSAWGVGVGRILDAPGGDRDTLRAGADAFGILPSADFADVHQAIEGDVTWTGALLGVDLGRPMLPPVFGGAELRVDLSSLEGTARFDELTVLIDGAIHDFRAPRIEYPIAVTGNTFGDEAGWLRAGSSVPLTRRWPGWSTTVTRKWVSWPASAARAERTCFGRRGSGAPQLGSAKKWGVQVDALMGAAYPGLAPAKTDGHPETGPAALTPHFLVLRTMREYQNPCGQSSRHRRLNVQTLTSNACSPFRRRTVSPFDPTDFGAPY